MEPPLALAVVGVAIHSAVGRTAPAAAAAVRAGIGRIREHEHMVDNAGDPFRLAFDSELEAPLRRGQRIASLATSALEQLVPQLEQRALPGSIPTFLCLPEPSDSFSSADATRISATLTNTFANRANLTCRTLTQGNAAGAVALQSAHALLSSGSSDACLVVGADSFIDPDILEPLDESGRVMSLSNRWGFPPGEGAAALLLVSKAKVRSLNMRALAEVHGVGIAHELHGREGDGVCVGEALADAFRQSVRSLGEPVAAHYCDIDGDRYREHEYSYAINRVHPEMFVDSTNYVAPAESWGAVGAASLVMLSALAIARQQRDAKVGPTSMAWAGSETGLRGSVVYRGAGKR